MPTSHPSGKGGPSPCPPWSLCGVLWHESSEVDEGEKAEKGEKGEKAASSSARELVEVLSEAGQHFGSVTVGAAEAVEAAEAVVRGRPGGVPPGYPLDGGALCLTTEPEGFT